jgi:hypothetical protein
MFMFRVVVAFIILSQAASAQAGTAQELIFKNSFERCDNFTVPPGAIEWDGGGDGESWSDPLNWKGNVIPADNDSVSIADRGGITVIYDNSLETTVLNIMDMCESLKITGGTLQIEGFGSVRTDMELSGGKLISNGDFSVSGTVLQNNNQSVVDVDGSGTVTVAGKYTWAAGWQDGSGETVFNGGIDIVPGNHWLRERKLTLNDASTWTGGAINTYLGATIDNNNVFDIQTDADLTYNQAPNSTLNNDGTITKSFSGDGDGMTQISANFVNSNTISVSSGELQLGRNDSNGTHAGSFTVSPGSIIGTSAATTTSRGHHSPAPAVFA